MVNQLKVHDQIKELFNSQMLGVLATEQNSQPHTSLVAFASSNDLKHILFATSRKTRKFSNLKENPSVAILVDSRSHRDSDFHSAIAVTAYGKAYEEKKDNSNVNLKHFLTKHPHLIDFVSKPTCALLKIKVEKYSIVSNFQNVRELVLES